MTHKLRHIAAAVAISATAFGALMYTAQHDETNKAPRLAPHVQGELVRLEVCDAPAGHRGGQCTVPTWD